MSDKIKTLLESEVEEDNILGLLLIIDKKPIKSNYIRAVGKYLTKNYSWHIKYRYTSCNANGRRILRSDWAAKINLL